MKKAYLILVTIIFSFLSIPLPGLAQLTDTANRYSNNTPKIKDRTSFKTFLPGMIAVSYGIVALGDGPLKNLDYDIAERRNNHRPTFHTTADDYLRYVPVLAIYGLEVFGIKGKHNLKEKTSRALVTLVISYGSINLLKNLIDKDRPNFADRRSFPSGHAAIAFTGAELLNQEYGDLSPWYSVAGYTVASATSILRIYGNDHWFSDVVAGAGMGILSTKVAYVIFPHLKKILVGDQKGNHFLAVPSYQNRTLGISVSGRF